MSEQEIGTALAVAGTPARWLTKAEADEAVVRGELARPSLHAVWDEETQQWMRLGEKVGVDVMRRETQPEALVAGYDERRTMLLRFVATKLVEAEYDGKRGTPIEGKLHHYYVVPGSKRKALTKTGGELLADLFRFRRAESRVTSSVETADYCSARVLCRLVDHWGRECGSHEAAASTAEPGFASPGARRKYGAQGKWEKGGGRSDWVESAPPDYRAALNDVVARAGKRAFVGAVIVAAAADEIFEVAAALEGDAPRDEDDRRVRTQPLPNARTTQAPAEKAEKALTIGGRPLSILTTAELEKVYGNLRTMSPEEQRKWERHVNALELELEDRRSFAVPPKAVREAGEDLLDLPLGDEPK